MDVHKIWTMLCVHLLSLNLYSFVDINSTLNNLRRLNINLMNTFEYNLWRFNYKSTCHLCMIVINKWQTIEMIVEIVKMFILYNYNNYAFVKFCHSCKVLLRRVSFFFYLSLIFLPSSALTSWPCWCRWTRSAPVERGTASGTSARQHHEQRCR